MKHVLLGFIALFISLVVNAEQKLDSTEKLLQQLDRAIEQRELYRSMREERIDQLRRLRQGIAEKSVQMYDVNLMLADTYEPFQFDSTLNYLNANLLLARQLNDHRRIDETNLRIAHLYTTAGYYTEAREIIDHQTDTLQLDNELLGRYYITMERFWSENRQYTRNPKSIDRAREQFIYYTQRIVDHLPADSERSLRARYELALEAGDLDAADAAMEELIDRVQPSSHLFAIYAYMKSVIEERRGHPEARMGWLARSASADLQSSIRDNASLATLSHLIFLQGSDINRAFRYIQIAMDDALFYNARLRPWQISSTLPLIESAYLSKQQKQMSTIQWLCVVIALLALIAAGVALMEVRQKRRTQQMYKQLQKANSQLESYMKRLSEINDRQIELNNEIREANAIKEEYIALFLGICSDYIDKMKNYQRSIRKRLASGSAQDLYKELGSSTLIDSYIEEFYNTFDNTFLRLYPNFVQEFNSLLNEDARIELKKGKPLNTELRIFALIRLGITDSSKIAALLRYSVNTIYNYRAKVKNNARVQRESFEEQIKRIGSFQEE